MGDQSGGLSDALVRAGRPARAFLTGAGLYRSAGLRPLWSYRRLARQLERAGTAPERALYRRIWQEASEALGAELVDLGGGFLEMRSGGRATRVWRNVVPLDTDTAHRVSLDKHLVHRILTALGTPVPEHLEFDRGDLAPARAFLARSGGACVVKPSGGSGGSGVTTGISDDRDLARARARASLHGEQLMIERQVQGDEYRMLFLDGILLDALRRDKASVVGDGRSSVSALIEAENRRRLSANGDVGLKLLSANLDCVLALRAQGLDLRSVVPSGEVVRVKGTSNENSERDNHPARDQVGTALVSEAAAAACAVGLRLAGVELITPDPQRSLSDAGGALLEVNGPPGLHYHYMLSDRSAVTPVAVPILTRLLEESRQAPLDL